MIAVSGTISICPSTDTTIPSSTASVSGRLIVKVEPRPSRELIEIRPPSDWIDRRTTSIPTPRPEMSDTVAAVEKPGMKMMLSISSSLITASGAISPLVIALSRTRARLIPAPSSDTSITMRPDRCSAASRTTPSAGLPIATRFSGVSSPWSMALRIICVSGSLRCSMTVLSTSVASPSVTSRTCLPVIAASSRA